MSRLPAKDFSVLTDTVNAFADELEVDETQDTDRLKEAGQSLILIRGALNAGMKSIHQTQETPLRKHDLYVHVNRAFELALNEAREHIRAQGMSDETVEEIARADMKEVRGTLGQIFDSALEHAGAAPAQAAYR